MLHFKMIEIDSVRKQSIPLWKSFLRAYIRMVDVPAITINYLSLNQGLRVAAQCQSIALRPGQ